MVTRGRRCPFAAWCIGIRLRVGRITALCPSGIRSYCRSWWLRCHVDLFTLTQRSRHTSRRCVQCLAVSRLPPKKTDGDAPHACPDCARRQCCVAPCVCFAASKRVARRVRRTRVPFASKPRATASFRRFGAIGTGLALRLAIGSTWIRCECNTKYSPQHRSGQRRPPNSVIDWVRGTPFLFPESLSPPAARRRSQPAH
jgi:hypothetical protein